MPAQKKDGETGTELDTHKELVETEDHPAIPAKPFQSSKDSLLSSTSTLASTSSPAPAELPVTTTEFPEDPLTALKGLFDEPSQTTPAELPAAIPAPLSVTDRDAQDIDARKSMQRPPLVTSYPSPSTTIKGDGDDDLLAGPSDEEAQKQAQAELLAKQSLPSASPIPAPSYPSPPPSDNGDKDAPATDLDALLRRYQEEEASKIASRKKDDDDDNAIATTPLSIGLPNGEKAKLDYKEKFIDIPESNEVRHKDFPNPVLRKNEKENTTEFLNTDAVVLRDFMHSLAEQDNPKVDKVIISGGTLAEKNRAAIAARLAGLKVEGHQLSEEVEIAIKRTKNKLLKTGDRKFDNLVSDTNAELEKIAIQHYRSRSTSTRLSEQDKVLTAAKEKMFPKSIDEEQTDELKVDEKIELDVRTTKLRDATEPDTLIDRVGHMSDDDYDQIIDKIGKSCSKATEVRFSAFDEKVITPTSLQNNNNLHVIPIKNGNLLIRDNFAGGKREESPKFFVVTKKEAETLGYDHASQKFKKPAISIDEPPSPTRRSSKIG